jgi:hypothetical protein
LLAAFPMPDPPPVNRHTFSLKRIIATFVRIFRRVTVFH